jgi:hypothetical protein
MMPQRSRILLTVNREADADEQQLSELTGRLREDLIDAGAESVERLRGGEAPAGSKGDAVTLASLLVALAPTALTGLIAALQSWLTRHERTSLTLQKGEQKITVTGTLSKEQQQIIASWLQAG